MQLVQIIRHLKADPEIAILPPDKGRGTMVMNKEDHVKIHLILGDGRYTALCCDATVRTE